MYDILLKFTKCYWSSSVIYLNYKWIRLSYLWVCIKILDKKLCWMQVHVSRLQKCYFPTCQTCHPCCELLEYYIELQINFKNNYGKRQIHSLLQIVSAIIKVYRKNAYNTNVNYFRSTYHTWSTLMVYCICFFYRIVHFFFLLLQQKHSGIIRHFY